MSTIPRVMMVTFHVWNEKLIFTSEEVSAEEEVFASTTKLCSSLLYLRASVKSLILCYPACKSVRPSVRNDRNLRIMLGIQFDILRYRPILLSGVGDRDLSDVTGTLRQDRQIIDCFSVSSRSLSIATAICWR